MDRRKFLKSSIMLIGLFSIPTSFCGISEVDYKIIRTGVGEYTIIFNKPIERYGVKISFDKLIT